MLRVAKILTWMFFGLVPLVAGCALFVYYYDWSRARPEINGAVSATLHRRFAINGKLGVTWMRDADRPGWRAYVPWPHIEMQDVTLANPDSMGGSGANFVSIDRVAFSIDPTALLDRQIGMPALVLDRPQASLMRNAAGEINWAIDFGSAPSIWRLKLHKIVIDGGHVDLQDDAQIGNARRCRYHGRRRGGRLRHRMEDGRKLQRGRSQGAGQSRRGAVS